MKSLRFGLAVAAMLLGLTQASQAATKFECPVRSLEAAQGPDIKAVLPSGDGFDKPELLNAAIAKLRQQGVSAALIIDGMVAAYCPQVAAAAGLSDAKKTARVQRFAGNVVRFVYGLASVEEIILNVPFPPDVVNAINAKAKEADVSPEEWVAGAVIGIVQ